MLILVAPEPVKPQVPEEVPKPLSVRDPTVTFETTLALAPLEIVKDPVDAPRAVVLFISNVPALTVVPPE